MDFLFEMAMGKPIWMWAAFLAVVLILLVLDLGVFNRRASVPTIRHSLWMSLFYIAIALLFAGWVWFELGPQSGKEFLTGYLIEKTLSMDNIFIISLVFSYFAIPREYQHRVLFWGILSVIVLRGIMIALGAVLIAQFSWVLHVFAVFLVFTGLKMLFMEDHDPDIGNNFILKILRRHFRITPELHGQKFFVHQPSRRSEKNVLWCTPLLVALVMVECVDVIFALDSVPAIFAITTDPYIVFTSNIFAILGLRSLYFALAAMVHRFSYLKQALALVLVFIGSKIFIADIMGWVKFPSNWSLGITLGLLAGGVLYSLYRTRTNKPVKFLGDN
ncbi:MAG TPA: hypothetical protein DIS76_05405 [Rhodospirillaceae bacterium]|nr:hypothetical protein [Rhodospirillaceae bacterium]